MGYLKEWIISVVTTVIFITIIELILPEGSIKKYVKLATGLLIMVAVLSPIFKILSDNISLNERISSYTSYISSYNQVDTKKANEEFKKKTRDTLIASLKENIPKEIKNKTGKEYVVIDLKLKKAKNDFDFDGIEYIEIKKVPKKEEIVTVDKIEIGEGSKTKQNATVENDVLKVLEKDFNVKGTGVKFVK